MKYQCAKLFRLLAVCFAAQFPNYVYAGCDQDSSTFRCDLRLDLCELVDTYVAEEKGWNKDGYIVENQGPHFGGIEVWVIHCTEVSKIHTEKSFALIIDEERKVIWDELQFQ